MTDFAHFVPSSTLGASGAARVVEALIVCGSRGSRVSSCHMKPVCVCMCVVCVRVFVCAYAQTPFISQETSVCVCV